MIVVSYLSSINIILGKYWIKHKTALNYKLSFFMLLIWLLENLTLFRGSDYYFIGRY